MFYANPPFESKYPIIDNISLSYNLVEYMLPNFHNLFLLPKWILKNKIIIQHPNVKLEKVVVCSYVGAYNDTVITHTKHNMKIP